jgi:hypothetical protein
MFGCYGLSDGYHPSSFPGDRIVERVPRLDVWMLSRCGALVEGSAAELAIEGAAGAVGGPPAIRAVNLRREAPNLWIDGTRVAIAWDEPMPGVGRPWFLCACGHRARYLYLRDAIACARCHKLQNASRHLNRQVPALGRVVRLRRKLGAALRALAGGGRSRARHDALVARIHDEEAALLDHLGGVIHDLSRRIRVRKERGKW